MQEKDSSTKKDLKIHYTNYNISYTEFMKDELVSEYGENENTLLDNEDLLRAVLYKYGVDVTKDFSFEICQHRNLANKVVMAPLFSGVERTDEQWKYIKRNVRNYYV